MPVRIVKRMAVIGDPPVFSVFSPKSVLQYKRLAGVERREEPFETACHVVGMNALGPAISRFLCQGAPRELKPSPIEVIALRVRITAPDKRGKSIQYRDRKVGCGACGIVFSREGKLRDGRDQLRHQAAR